MISSVARGFRVAILDPSHHLTLDIIGEDAMGGFASTVLAESAYTTDLKLGTDWLVLELWDQVKTLAKDLGIAFIGSELSIWVDLVVGDSIVELGVGFFPLSGFLSSLGLHLPSSLPP
jgi:hypothetical protein